MKCAACTIWEHNLELLGLPHLLQHNNIMNKALCHAIIGKKTLGWCDKAELLLPLSSWLFSDISTSDTSYLSNFSIAIFFILHHTFYSVYSSHPTHFLCSNYTSSCELPFKEKGSSQATLFQQLVGLISEPGKSQVRSYEYCGSFYLFW